MLHLFEIMLIVAKKCYICLKFANTYFNYHKKYYICLKLFYINTFYYKTLKTRNILLYIINQTCFSIAPEIV